MNPDDVVLILTALGIGGLLKTLLDAFFNRRSDAIDITVKLQDVWSKQLDDFTTEIEQLRIRIAELEESDREKTLHIARLETELAIYRHNQG